MRAMASTWSYDDENSWKSLPGSQAGGNKQSPVDIFEANIDKAVDLKPIKLNSHWFKGVNGSLVNTGTSLKFNLSEDSGAVSATTTTGHYRLVQFHFHWGPCSGRGSEHTINGVSMDSELHFVLENEDSSKRDYAVLGVLLKSTNESLMDANSSWEVFSPPPKFNHEVVIADYPIHHLLPSTLNYWHYSGSLTTPPCTEIVNWYVLQEVLPIPAPLLEEWRKMEQDVSGTPLVSNYRAIQPLNGRQIVSFIQ